jgi:hypothetical protein
MNKATDRVQGCMFPDKAYDQAAYVDWFTKTYPFEAFKEQADKAFRVKGQIGSNIAEGSIAPDTNGGKPWGVVRRNWLEATRAPGKPSE